MMATSPQGEIDIPITKIELPHGISAGVWLGYLIEGNIPVFEEHAARLERGIGLDAWANMDVDEKAMIVAMRRLSMQLANLQAEAEITRAEKKK
jgi:alcohol dehydrogenase class IV